MIKNLLNKMEYKKKEICFYVNIINLMSYLANSLHVGGGGKQQGQRNPKLTLSVKKLLPTILVQKFLCIILLIK